MKLILLCVWAEWAILGSAKTASNSNMKFKQAYATQCMDKGIRLKSDRNNS